MFKNVTSLYFLGFWQFTVRALQDFCDLASSSTTALMFTIGRCVTVKYALNSSCQFAYISPVHKPFFLRIRLSPSPHILPKQWLSFHRSIGVSFLLGGLHHTFFLPPQRHVKVKFFLYFHGSQGITP